MKLEQVITILKSEQTKATISHRPDIYLAHHIAIEAVKREQRYRDVVKPRDVVLLPGETK